jgi:acetyltransferase-like isoleucine patch superfamily enzyme
VTLGHPGEIEEFVIIGKTYSRNVQRNKPRTIIGDNFLIRSHTVIYHKNKIGRDFKTGHHVLIREDNIIEDNVSIGSSSVIEHHVRIGNNVRIHSQSFIPEYSVLEDDCWIGPNVVFTNSYHPKCSYSKKCLKGPVIKKNAKIGANATILPYITIGENSIVGAGAVVVSDVKPNSVVVGSPAKEIKKVKDLKCLTGITRRPY